MLTFSLPAPRPVRQQEQDEDQVYFNFINSIKSQATKIVYETYLKNFMNHYGLSKMSDLLKLEVQNSIIKYLIALREKGLSSNSISVRLNVRLDTVRFDLSCCEIPWDIPNWVTLIVEIFVAIALGAYFYWRQEKAKEHVDELIEKKAKLEQENKTFECDRIIGHLKEILESYQSLKTFLIDYQVGDQTKENLRLILGMSFDSLAIKSIWRMDDAIKQLQGMLKDRPLRLDFLKNLGAMNVIPKFILKENMP